MNTAKYVTRVAGQAKDTIETNISDALRWLRDDIQAVKDFGYNVATFKDGYTATDPETGFSETVVILFS